MILWNKGNVYIAPLPKDGDIIIKNHGGPFEGPTKERIYVGERTEAALRETCLKIYNITGGDFVQAYCNDIPMCGSEAYGYKDYLSSLVDN
jgi:hypothetical protein